ncbi:MAG: hypothetical protein U0514_00660 [Candidatus Andersenbacteria bacterium]
MRAHPVRPDFVATGRSDSTGRNRNLAGRWLKPRPSSTRSATDVYNGVAHLEPVDRVAVDEVYAYVGGFVTRTGALLCSARRGEPITPRLSAFPPGLVYGNVGIDGFALDPRNNGGW